MMTIRQATINDAASLSTFLLQLDNESEYLLFDPGERTNTIEMMLVYLQKIIENKKSMVFLAENEEKNVVGFICGEVLHFNRMSHVMKLNIGIIKKYRRTGIGRALGKHMLAHVEKNNIVRVEATIITDNKLSLNLCKKFGMAVEGVKRCSIKIGNQFYDEYLLARIMS